MDSTHNLSHNPRLKLATSLKELLCTKHLDDISVVDITSKCGMTRQVFYKYFSDKYDLIEWIFINDCCLEIGSLSNNVNCNVLLRSFIMCIHKNINYYRNVLNSSDLSTFYKFLEKLLSYCMSGLVAFMPQADYSGMENEVSFLTDFYAKAVVHSVVDNMTCQHNISDDILYHWMTDAIPNRLKIRLSGKEIPVSSFTVFLRNFLEER